MTLFKTTHVGSFPRPAEMLSKQLRKQAVSDDALRQYLKDIVAKQAGLGLNIINNGELPRTDYVSATLERISGFSGTDRAPIPRDMAELPDYSRRFNNRNGLITLNPKAPVMLPVCTAPLQYTGEASVKKELGMMAAVADDLNLASENIQLFFTSPSPGTLAHFMGNTHYPDYETYMTALAEVLKQEYETIAGYGYLVQIDCPDLAMGRHTAFSHLSDSEFLTLLDTNISALNRALSGIPEDQVRIHVCWGNYAGTHHCDIELKTILPALGKLRARFISLEASNHRHAHEWTVFRDQPFPDDKVLLPGLIDTATPMVEHPDLVAQRLVNFAEILGPERVIGSTDCGFSTTASATAVSEEIAWMKLATLVEGARRAEKQFK
jgi:5-methyltetrahydropteroyltriglutamate--homocysteine methyltransferase